MGYGYSAEKRLLKRGGGDILSNYAERLWGSTFTLDNQLSNINASSLQMVLSSPPRSPRSSLTGSNNGS